MGFFKDFKDDLSEAVNDLAGENLENELDDVVDDDGDLMVNTLDDPELAKMAEDLKKEAESEEIMETSISDQISAELSEEDTQTVEETVQTEVEEEAVEEEISEEEEASLSEDYISDETAVITDGLSIKGDLNSLGSIDLFGAVEGSVVCRGKLTVSGSIIGDSSANEIFANSAQIDGNVDAKGSVKIGQGTVIVGNITATSAVIAGAVKGDIDVHGPVIVDSSAIIVGDIKSKTVQINNGATIDGRCSQCYADVNTSDIFNIKTKNKKK